MDKKTVIITGAGQGIGRATAEFLLNHDYAVSIWENNPDALAEVQTELAAALPDAQFLRCDVSDEKSVKKAVSDTVKHFGRIDALINNAAVMQEKSLDELTFAEWNEAIGVNLSGAFLCAKYAVPHLRENRGTIISLCSTRAFQSEPDTFGYSASKGGIFALTHSLAMSLGPDVRANCISPGWIDVSGLKTGHPDAEKLSTADHSQHPAGRVGRPADIARMILFLLDDANDFITGQNFIIDGGMTRKMIYV
ncbi:SDR family oxidoreductase [Fibrella aquatilis]|uniref:SDR family oxidoreductase n=1 Tax=Fibrella aquatilis TaxID=2817059 RepID=A0A939G3U2_9BACT|nr:SDR family oxidoreductase [Fibrella aquatilis]MBO0930590.1 SDR family oxidoreductase [Fibrella aquatilis]